jgi:imidazole glycerol-phosphate synthase subunit HisH
VQLAVCETGLGNVRSVVRAIERASLDASLDVRVSVTPDPDVVRRADVVVVPGQGAFGAFVHAVKGGGGLGEALLEVIGRGTPYLGICLGLQMLFEESEEAVGDRGLGVLRGRVERLVPGTDETGHVRPLPHMGWNLVEPASGDASVLGPEARHFYFAHSYAAAPLDPSVVAATARYGPPFAAAIAKDNIVGVQFHPEKSQRDGLLLLARFLTRAARGGH